MKILVINSGSSSIKYQLFDMGKREVMAAGLIERIGSGDSQVRYRARSEVSAEQSRSQAVADHREGLRIIAELLTSAETGVITRPSEITAVGHRVVHGGEHFSATVRIDERVQDTIRRLIPLAPLHNPANLKGIEVAREIFPQAVQVAVFDTAFHQTIPEEAYRYAIPEAYYRNHGVRVYGFHGTSHLYVTKKAAEYLGRVLEKTNLITAHLGNGASITAVRGGKSVDTSMGFSPLPGLMMGTRCGDIDPSVIFYMHRALGLDVDAIDALLNRKSGLLGVGGSNDLRDILERAERGEKPARLALKMYTYRIRKYIGAYTAVLNRVDGLVFTAGVGENSPLVRQMSCEGLGHLGIQLDDEKNRAPKNGIREIQSSRSRVRILVIPTNEELEIALQTERVVQAGKEGGDANGPGGSGETERWFPGRGAEK